MLQKSVTIFLISPKNKSTYKDMIVFADNIEEARIAANVAINPLKIKNIGDDGPLINHIYDDENLSTCQEITVEVTLVEKDTIHIKHLGKEYYLTRNFAKGIND